MNSYERVMNRLDGKSVDRLPNLSLVMMFAAKQIGVSYGAFCSDYRLLADSAFVCHEKFGFDMVCAISDPMREAEGFGAQLVIPEDAVPKEYTEPVDTEETDIIYEDGAQPTDAQNQTKEKEDDVI